MVKQTIQRIHRFLPKLVKLFVLLVLFAILCLLWLSNGGEPIQARNDGQNGPNVGAESSRTLAGTANTTAAAVIHKNTTEGAVKHENTTEDAVIHKNTTEDAVIHKNTTEDAVIHKNKTVNAVIHKNKTVNAVVQLFTQSKLQGTELQVFLQTLDAFIDVVSRAGVPYFLYSGSLIGSWRHHGFIPWDDDLDLMLPKEKMPEIESAFAQLDSDYRLSKRSPVRWKVFSKRHARVQNVHGLDWGYPFLDVSFWVSNATHIWDLDIKVFTNFVYPVGDVFPLSVRPFQGRYLLAPRDTKAFLEQTYPDVDTRCVSSYYDHRLEIGVQQKKRKTIPCRQLYSHLPFVVRHPALLDAVCTPTSASPSSSHLAPSSPQHPNPPAGGDARPGVSAVVNASSSVAGNSAVVSAVGCMEMLVLDSAVVSCFVDRNPC